MQSMAGKVGQMQTINYLLKAFNAEGQANQARIDAPAVSRENLAEIFAELGFKKMVEIGVHRGYYSNVLCQMNPGLNLTCVDPWPHEEHYIEACRVLRPHKCTLLRMQSTEAAKYFSDNSIDGVYIDGNHGLPWITKDLNTWPAKVRPGGIIAGHDFLIANHTRAARNCKVVQAVSAHVAAHNIRPLFIIGMNYKDKVWPSWLWVKT